MGSLLAFALAGKCTTGVGSGKLGEFDLWSQLTSPDERILRIVDAGR